MSPNISLDDPRELERQAHNVVPGGWAVGRDRPFSTLLGSCVAVCLYDPQTCLAGINHYLLPHCSSATDDDPDIILAGAYSLEVLVNDMALKGARKSRLVAKAFGGGVTAFCSGVSIGERNVRFAREWLEREGIPLVASDFGGAWSRKVVFQPSNGDTYCRRLPITRAATAPVEPPAQCKTHCMGARRWPEPQSAEIF